MTDRKDVNDRFDELSKEQKDVLNEMAMHQFSLPIKQRAKPKWLLYFIEFKN